MDQYHRNQEGGYSVNIPLPETTYFDKLKKLGGTYTISDDANQKFLGCLCGPAHNGCCRVISLRSAVIIFSILDILCGLWAVIDLADLGEIIEFIDLETNAYYVKAFYCLRPIAIIAGFTGIVNMCSLEMKAANTYLCLKLFELFVLTPLTLLSILDFCQAYIFINECDDIKMSYSFYALWRAMYQGYGSYLAYSVAKRIQRGEFVLICHGKKVVDMLNSIESQNTKNTQEMVAVQGIIVGAGAGGPKNRKQKNNSELQNMPKPAVVTGQVLNETTELDEEETQNQNKGAGDVLSDDDDFEYSTQDFNKKQTKTDNNNKVMQAVDLNEDSDFEYSTVQK